MGEGKANVYGYTRVSTEGQAKQGYSLSEQRAEIEKYCKENQFNLVKMFSDEGVSGAKADENEMCIEREGLMDMLISLKTRNVSYVVVLNTSRLWRSDLVKILIQKEFKKYDVDVKAIDRPGYSIYTQNPNEVFVNGMFELLDVYERLEIALKLQRGRLEKAKQGGYAGGGAPFGYENVRGSKALYINEKEADAVRRLFHLRGLFPRFSLQKLSDYMNMEGYKGRNGADFNAVLVKRILDREMFYRGYYNYGGIKSEGKHEAIIKDKK